MLLYSKLLCKIALVAGGGGGGGRGGGRNNYMPTKLGEQGRFLRKLPNLTKKFLQKKFLSAIKRISFLDLYSPATIKKKDLYPERRLNTLKVIYVANACPDKTVPDKTANVLLIE